MIPKLIVLENFLSFGSPATEIVFADDEPLWVIGGPNGVGKSAVFDAMTYALFAEHRGGASDHASLVRHGANGFRVIFEFEFNGMDYRITRNRPRSGRPTQRVERRAGDGGWAPVELPAAAGRQDAVKLWAERILGLGFSAFRASVLLRQGEADAIITAGATERLTILKKVIGAERYESLSNTVHAAAKRCKDRFEDLQTQLNGLTPVTDDEVQAAQEELAQAEIALSAARTAATEAANRVPLAKQWVKLESDRQRLEQQIRDAEAHLKETDAIKAKYARLNDLKAVVPVLRQAVALGGRLSDATDMLGKLRDEEKLLAEEVDRLTAAVGQEMQKAEERRRQAEELDGEAKQLREEIERQGKVLPTAEEVERLQAKLAEFPPDLAAQLDDAHEKVKSATDDFTTAGQERAKVAGALEPALNRQRQYEEVEVGVPCSRCGQPVSEENAKRERARLAEEVQELQQKHNEAEAKEKRVEAAKKAPEEEWERLNALEQDQGRRSRELTEKKTLLARFGVTAGADELRRQIDALKTEAEGHEQKARTEKEGWQAAEAEANRLAKERDKMAQRLITDLDGERQQLIESGVAEKFQKVEQDATRQAEWVKQLGEVANRIAEVPSDCRLSIEGAQFAAEQAEGMAGEAERIRNTAKERAGGLARRAEAYQEKVKEVAKAERQADLHGKLDELLGKKGLQLALVRSAEREIVRLANDTVQNLSDGDLTIELDDSADGGDEAFALRVRVGDAPMPTGVNYLSGSQKFRVAVSIALAIGRFAAGQARPLESVIIDEGFGSLDRDGLRAVADELNRLRQHLRRIVLVSHQDDFADRFPVVIKLTHGENGTTAEALRR
jgi:DNA repair exonuclease SbcCD ATPase subunit